MKTDNELEADIQQALKLNPFLKNELPEIKVRNGIATARGFVENYSKKVTLEKEIKKIKGVRALVSDIAVNLPEAGEYKDTEIAGAVLHSLKWHAAVPEEQIQVTVENGWVRLDGMVDWNYQKKAADAAVVNLKGIKGFSNKLEVRLSETEKDTEKQLNDAIKRSSRLISRDIKAKVEGNKVTLNGEVYSIGEKEEAEDLAFSLPGIISVENNLEVNQSAFVF